MFCSILKICSLPALPFPVMDCFTFLGEYSVTGTPQFMAAAMATPCARPSLSILRGVLLHQFGYFSVDQLQPLVVVLLGVQLQRINLNNANMALLRFDDAVPHYQRAGINA